MPPNWHVCPHLWPPNGSNQTALANDNAVLAPDENSAAACASRPMPGWRQMHSVRQTIIPIVMRTLHALWIPLNVDCQLHAHSGARNVKEYEMKKRRKSNIKSVAAAGICAA